MSITLEGQIAKLEDLLNHAKQHKQIAAGVSATTNRTNSQD